VFFGLCFFWGGVGSGEWGRGDGGRGVFLLTVFFISLFFLYFSNGHVCYRNYSRSEKHKQGTFIEHFEYRHL
jgi:hypothetical protein